MQIMTLVVVLVDVLDLASIRNKFATHLDQEDAPVEKFRKIGQHLPVCFDMKTELPAAQTTMLTNEIRVQKQTLS